MGKPFIEKLEITDIASQGKAIGKRDEKVYFVDSLVPGDIADVQVFRNKKKFAEAFPVTIHTYSNLRTEPACKHFGECGGCRWQHLSYAAQLSFKQKQTEDALLRIGKLKDLALRPIIGADAVYEYRNKLEFTFSNKRWITKTEVAEQTPLGETNALGFHIPGRFDKILDIETCHLQAEPSNTIRNFVRQYALQHALSFYDIRNHTGLLRNLIIRTSSTGECMLIVAFAQENEEQIAGLMKALEKQFSPHSLMYVVNTKRNDTLFDQNIRLFSGNPYITEKLGQLQYRISPKSFFQTNTEQAKKLYDVTLQFARLSGNENVYDLYTGTGTIANYIAHAARQVTGIEYIEDAVSDARINAALNGIKNTTFLVGDLKDVFTDEMMRTYGKPDVIITDPPRAGMHPDVVAGLCKSGASRIVYVSCNPATQARDVEAMQEYYRAVYAQPVDMFPHTQHVENVLLLEKK